MFQYIIYCRKSSESEERQVLSIESQVKELKELADRLKLPISEILTESQSAKYPGRPIFNAMMKQIYKSQIKGIIAWKPDRLARNPIDGSSLVWALDEGKIAEIVTPYGTFLNSSSDKMMLQIEFSMAKKYVDDLSDNVKRGNRAKLDKGWLPGLAPLGYLNEPTERTIVVDQKRFPLVRMMWDMLLASTSPSRILDIANNQWGFRTRTNKKCGGKPLGLSNLYKIFGNPFYYGLMERKEGTFIGKHEPMITEDEYWKAQEILCQRGRPRPKKHKFAFTGLIRCAECNGMITAEEKTNRYGYHYVYYRCTKKKRNTICHQKYINAKDLEAQIVASLEKIHVHNWLFDRAMEYLKEEAKEEGYIDIQASLEKALSLCQKKLDNLNRMRLGDLIDDEEYLREKKTLITEKFKLEKSLKNGSADEKRSDELTGKTFIFANEAKERFLNGAPEDKRSVFREIGSNFSLKDKKLTIYAAEPFQIIEKGLKAIQMKIEPLEPRNNGFIKGENEASAPVIQQWCTLVEDVRTFYLKKCIAGNSKQTDRTNQLN